jgi:hypothetical protein
VANLANPGGEWQERHREEPAFKLILT